MTALAEVGEIGQVDAFAASRERFEVVVGWLQGEQAGGMEHAALEMCLQEESREVFRQLFQDHCDLRALQEQRLEAVVDVDQVARTRVATSHRALTGAHWSLNGAEAILKLRAIHSNGDFDDYWTYHLVQARQRTHQSRYADNLIPAPA